MIEGKQLEIPYVFENGTPFHQPEKLMKITESEKPKIASHQAFDRIREEEVGFNIEKSYEQFRSYVVTYTQQNNWKTYSADTYLNDMLYGLGISLNESKYSFANGYDQFKADLKFFIESRKDQNEY